MGMIEELTSLKKEIDAAKKNVSQLEGRSAEVFERLKKDFDVDSIETAEKLLLKLQHNLTKQNTAIEADFAKLKENFSW